MAARVRRRGLRTVLAILILSATHLVYSLAATGASLLSVQSAADRLLGSAGSSDLSAISHRVRGMAAAGISASAGADGAGVALLSLLPALGADVDLFRFIGHTAGDTGRFAVDASRSMEHIAGGDHTLAAAIYRDERLNFDTIRELERLANDSYGFLDSLATAANRLQAPLFDASKRLQARLQRTLLSASDAARKGYLAAGMLPQLAAEGTSKTYLLAFQSPSEARGSGGIIGVYGILTADDGAVRLAHVGPHSEIGKDVKGPISAPKWYRDLYGGLLALDEIRHANLGAHWPTVARVVLEYYRVARNRLLDGVITLDPIVLEQVTSGTPPLTGPGWDVKVDETNARKVLLKSSYLRFGQYQERAQDRFLEGLVADLLGHLRAGRVNAAALVRGLLKAANWQHLKVYATDAALQQTLGALELTGDFTRAGTNVQEVFHNNFTGSKVDYFLYRDQKTVVELKDDGDAEITLTVTLENRAPTEPSSLLIRPLLRKYPNGYNRMTLSFLMPRGAAFGDFSIDGKKSPPLRGNEIGYPVVWNIVDIPSQETVEASVRYTLPDAMTDGAFSMTLWPQALVRPDSFRFELHVPDGRSLDVFPRRRLLDGAYVLTGRLFGPKRITAEIGT